MILGIAISIMTFAMYYFLIEKEVYEYRLTYSVSASDYSSFSSIDQYYTENSSGKLNIFPNYESIADSLKEKDIRRFELRLFSTGDPHLEEPPLGYWESNQLSTPELVRNRYVGESTPLKTSVGYSVLLLILFLAFGYIGNTRSSRNQSDK